MQMPPEVKFKGVETNPTIDRIVARGLAGLEKVCDYIISTRITVEQAQGRRQTGNVHRMRIDIRIPDRPDIVVRRTSSASKPDDERLTRMDIEDALADEVETESTRPATAVPNRVRVKREEPLIALIRRTFDSAQRELQKTVDKQRGDVKTPAQLDMSGVVETIFTEQGYGFLRAADSQQQVYFNQNSMLHRHWENLTVGTVVRYTQEDGEKGLQATTVEPVDKRGGGEMHGSLHPLPGG